MNFYNMTDTERQILINQYAILKKGEKNKEKLNDLNKKIEYLENGYIYLFKNLNSLQPIFHEQECVEIMNILGLHDIMNISAKNNNMKNEELAFDFNNDGLYPYFIQEVIKSKDYAAYNDFEVKNSHGAKNLKDHKRQLKYWKDTLGKKLELSVQELTSLINYQQLS